MDVVVLILIQRVLCALVAVALFTLGSATAWAEDPTPTPTPAPSTSDQILDAVQTAAGAVSCLNPVTAAATSVLTDAGCLQAAGTVAGPVADAVGSGLKSVARSAGESLAESFGETGVDLMRFGLTWWTETPGVTPGLYKSVTTQVTAYTYNLQYAALIFSIIVLAGRLVIARSGAIRDTSEEGLRTITRATLVAGGISAAITAGLHLSDGLSTWLIQGLVGDQTADLADKMIPLSRETGGIATAMLFVIGIVGILGGLVLMFLLLLRSGLLIVITAAMPIAAAASGTGTGSQSFDKMLSWAIAFLLFKPVGSLVIGVAWITFQRATDNGTDSDPATVLIGALLLCSTAFVLPSLMRLIAPAVATLGGGGSGMAAAAGAAAVVGGAVKAGTGAVSMAAGAASGGAGLAASAIGAAGSRSSGGAPSGSAPPSFGTRGQQPSGGGAGTPPTAPPPPAQTGSRWSGPSGTSQGGFRR
jgi:type IV secretion system protein TrbL